MAETTFEQALAALDTELQRAFVREYLVDLNATAAAKRAGYSEDSARSIGSENLTKPNIQSALSIAMAERSRRTDVTADRVLKELARIAFADTRSVVRWGPDGVSPLPSDQLSEDDAACVSEVSETSTDKSTSIRVKLHDKIAALDKLGRHLGMFKERVELSGPNGGPITLEDMVVRSLAKAKSDEPPS